MPNMILVKLICYVDVGNNFLTFIKHITFTRIMLGMPLGCGALQLKLMHRAASRQIMELMLFSHTTIPENPVLHFDLEFNPFLL